MLEQWLRSYRPEELFDDNGRLLPDLVALAPKGNRRMGANPHANGGKEIVNLDLPNFRRYAIAVTRPATERCESTRQLGQLMRDLFRRSAQPRNFRLFCPR
jgi:xylulose-5-phosphate/fructose-6-phosphate phosphoketolase